MLSAGEASWLCCRLATEVLVQWHRVNSKWDEARRLPVEGGAQPAAAIGGEAWLWRQTAPEPLVQ